jgi:hypothetical protein
MLEIRDGIIDGGLFLMCEPASPMTRTETLGCAVMSG